MFIAHAIYEDGSGRRLCSLKALDSTRIVVYLRTIPWAWVYHPVPEVMVTMVDKLDCVGGRCHCR